MSTPTVDFQNHQVRELRDGSSRVLITPEHGARLLTWDVNESPVIHWPQDADWSNVAKIRGGNPILFPFIARHMVDGEIGLWLDEDGNRHALPMHGFARNSAFEVDEAASDEKTIRLRLTDSERTREGFPFAFEFAVGYRLIGNTLECRFETTNKGDKPLPCYPGHHFYFAVPHEERADWEVSIAAQRWGRQMPSDGSMTYEEATSQVCLLSADELVDRMHVNLQSTRAELRNLNGGQRVVFDLESAAAEASWYAVTTWTLTPESDFYCVEPWLGLPNAIHHKDGLRWVAPGETEVATCRLTAEGWA